MGFLDKLRASMARFMSGRYGADQLSMAMVIAALCAEGTTTIEDAHYIERGYEDIIGKFAALGARTLGGTMGSDLQTIILASSVLYELIGPGCAKLSLYLSHSYSNKLEDITPEPEPDETGCPKSEVERLIERINAIQSELPAHRAVYYEDEKAFSDAAEEHYAALYRALPAERRKR